MVPAGDPNRPDWDFFPGGGGFIDKQRMNVGGGGGGGEGEGGGGGAAAVNTGLA